MHSSHLAEIESRCGQTAAFFVPTDHIEENNMTALTFEEWLAAAEQLLLAQVGVGLLELVDCPYRDWYAGGMTPEEVARAALANELNDLANIFDIKELWSD